MLHLRRAVGTLVATVTFLGCGPSSSSGDPAGGAASGGSSGSGNGGVGFPGGANNEIGSGGSGRAGTGPTSGGATGASGADDGRAHIGRLQLIRVVKPPGSTLTSATFDSIEQAAGGGAGESCPTETYGACVVTKCPDEGEMNPVPPAPTSSDLLDAGTITLSADKGNFSSTATPTAANHAYIFTSTGSLVGAELVTISSTGGTVPAFSSEIQVPLAPLLLTPSLAGSQGTVDVPVPRTGDFTFTWDARGTSQKLQLAVEYPSGTTGKPWLSCNFDAAAGTGTFPVGALSQFTAGIRIRVFGVNNVVAQTARGTVAILAAFETLSADKASFPTFVLE